ncbi:MAG: HlyC/CorC family transporter [Selenomonadaceae bacterium]|nr:HlyC/CorC family transporter [Selenomonadaceae bacterium]
MSANPSFFIMAAVVITALAAFLSLAESAIINAKKSVIEKHTDKKERNAALKLLDSQEDASLLTEILMMMLGIVAGLIAGLISAPYLSEKLSFLPNSYIISLVLNICGTTFVLILLGAFLPKKIAQMRPEKYLLRYQRVMSILLMISRPIINLFSGLSKNILLFFGFNADFEETVTEDEVKDLIEQGTEDGTIEKAEQDMVESIFSLGDQTAYSLMTPRTQMLWLDLEDSDKINFKKIEENPDFVFPAGFGSLDENAGFIYAKDLLSSLLAKETVHLKDFVRKPMTIPRSMEALRVIEKIQSGEKNEALVIDEYGGVVGFISLNDILLKLIGEDKPNEEQKAFSISKKDEKEWSLDGLCPIDEFKEYFEIETLPKEDRGHFQTMGGFVTALFGYIPKRGEKVQWEKFTFEVLAMDRARIKKISVVAA